LSQWSLLPSLVKLSASYIVVTCSTLCDIKSTKQALVAGLPECGSDRVGYRRSKAAKSANATRCDHRTFWRYLATFRPRKTSIASDFTHGVSPSPPRHFSVRPQFSERSLDEGVAVGRRKNTPRLDFADIANISQQLVPPALC